MVAFDAPNEPLTETVDLDQLLVTVIAAITLGHLSHLPIRYPRYSSAIIAAVNGPQVILREGYLIRCLRGIAMKRLYPLYPR